MIAAATCLFAIVEGFKNVIASVAGQNINLWLLAVMAGGVTALFTAISFLRTFSVRVDTEGMTSRVSGSRWKRLQVGAMPWKDIRSLGNARTEFSKYMRPAEGFSRSRCES